MKSLSHTLGVDLAALDGKPVAEITPDCPGAFICVTRDDLQALQQGGERFLESQSRTIPGGGLYGHARVLCRNTVEVGPKGVAGYPVVYGLCASCTSLERTTNATLKYRAEQRANAAKERR